MKWQSSVLSDVPLLDPEDLDLDPQLAQRLDQVGLEHAQVGGQRRQHGGSPTPLRIAGLGQERPRLGHVGLGPGVVHVSRHRRRQQATAAGRSGSDPQLLQLRSHLGDGGRHRHPHAQVGERPLRVEAEHGGAERGRNVELRALAGVPVAAWAALSASNMPSFQSVVGSEPGTR